MASNIKTNVARLSIFSNTLLIILKFIIGIIGGSVSIMSEAIHSLMDLLAAIIAYFSVKVSDNPPDKDHPYGHGKIENVSGVIEALLIFVAAIWIIYEAIMKLIHNSPIESIGLGSLVMFISAGVNLYVSRRLYKVARQTESIALEADALHLRTDIITSAGVGIGLLLIWITGLTFLDPIIAITVALIILKESYNLLKHAYNPLLDTSLSNDEIQKIENILNQRSLKFHNLKTRKAGNYRFAEFHLELSEDSQLKEVHKICDQIEDSIKLQIKNIDVLIHVEPFESKVSV